MAFHGTDRVVVDVDRAYLDFLMRGFIGNGFIDNEKADVIEDLVEVRAVAERQAVIQ